MKSSRLYRIAIVAVALVMLGALPARAEVEEGTAILEFYAGIYIPDDPLEDGLTIGGRGGYRFHDKFCLEGTLGYFKDEPNDFVDYRAWYVECSAVWYANPQSPAVLMLFGGPGVFISDIRTDYDSSEKFALSLHGGLGFHIALGDRVYLRPEGRFRWVGDGVAYHDDEFYDLDSGSFFDTEASLALGFTFGTE